MRQLSSLRQIGVNLQSKVAALVQQITLLYSMVTLKKDPVSIGVTIANGSDAEQTVSLFDVLGLNGLAANHGGVTITSSAFKSYTKFVSWLKRYEVAIGGYKLTASDEEIFDKSHEFLDADFDRSAEAFNLEQGIQEGRSGNVDEKLVVLVNHFFMLDVEKGFKFVIPAGETLRIDFNVLFTTRNYWAPIFAPKVKR